jgi:hypothetical protein
MAHKYTMENISNEFNSLYVHANQPYKQKMFSCVPAEFILDPLPPQNKDFQETKLKSSTLPLPKVEN